MQKAAVILSLFLAAPLTANATDAFAGTVSDDEYKTFMENAKSLIDFNEGNPSVKLAVTDDKYVDLTKEDFSVNDLNGLDFDDEDLAFVADAADEKYMNIWNEWKATHNKVYSSEEEEAKRFKIFVQTDKYITEFNQGDNSFKLGHNLFSDMTPEEKAKYTGLRRPKPSVEAQFGSLWSQWKQANKKVYASVAEEAKRFKIFVENAKFVNEFNKENSSVRVSLNKFADLTKEEFSATYMGLKRPEVADEELVFTADAAEPTVEAQFGFLWNQWRHSNKKVYASPAEEAKRFKIFMENAQFVLEFNKENPSVKLTLNKFSDLTKEEFSATYKGLKRPEVADEELVFTADTADEQYMGVWNQWKATQNKVYSSDEEEAKRFKIFVETDKRINEFNQGDHSFKMGHNLFSDMTPEEKAKYTGLRRSEPTVEAQFGSLWSQWKQTNKKIYASVAEAAKRFKIFVENAKFINEFNKENSSVKLSLNKFSDLTKEEFSATYMGLKRPEVADEELVFTADAADEQYMGAWNEWKATHNKVYSSDEEEAKRFKIFIETDKRINEFNQENDSSKMGHNQFSDLTKEEFKANHLGLRRPEPTLQPTVEAQFGFLWNQWRHSNKKVYASAAEEAKRFKIFMQNAQFIIEFNKENPSVKLRINEFADQTSEEFAATHNGFRQTQ